MRYPASAPRARGTPEGEEAETGAVLPRIPRSPAKTLARAFAQVDHLAPGEPEPLGDPGVVTGEILPQGAQPVLRHLEGLRDLAHAGRARQGKEADHAAAGLVAQVEEQRR